MDENQHNSSQFNQHQATPITPVAPVASEAELGNHPHQNRFRVFFIVFVIIAYLLGYNMGHKGYTFVPKDFKIVNQDGQPQNVDYNLLWQALTILNTKYIDKPVDQ